MLQNFTSLLQMTVALPNDTACREYLELLRWNGVPTCPHCGIVDSAHYKLKVKGEFKGLYKCCECKERFTVTIGTVFEGSNIGLQKWFMALYLFSAHKKGISSHQLARDLGVTQKTAWYMLHRLRETFIEKMPEPLGGEGVIVEADTTYIGGKTKNMHKSKRREFKGSHAAAMAFRYNNRKITDKMRFDMALTQTAGVKLPYSVSNSNIPCSCPACCCTSMFVAFKSFLNVSMLTDVVSCFRAKLTITESRITWVMS